MAQRKDKKKLRIKVINIFNRLKSESKTSVPPIALIYDNKKHLGYLRAVTKSTMEDLQEIKRLSNWRKKSEAWFPAQFKITDSGTKKWVEERLLHTKDRFLFIIETPNGTPLGHIGLFRFDFDKKTCEIDNVIRGEDLAPGIMTPSILTLIDWTKRYIGFKKFQLEVFSDNEKAIRLYKRCGFKADKKVPLKKVVENDRVSWVEDATEKKPMRYNLYMVLR